VLRNVAEELHGCWAWLLILSRWGYTYVDEIVWVKMTTNRRLAKSHGYYLQHAKEVCLVGKKGDDPAGLCSNVLSDIIMRCVPCASSCAFICGRGLALVGCVWSNSPPNSQQCVRNSSFSGLC